jgi:hypothetical protein
MMQMEYINAALLISTANQCSRLVNWCLNSLVVRPGTAAKSQIANYVLS